MMSKYSPSSIEKKWQEIWSSAKIYQPNLKNPENPFYNLMMFPYPSAEGLHVGNVYAFTGADVFGRFKRMKGFDVFEPMGLDGFGIHSENFAIKKGEHPARMAKKTEKHFYEQLSVIGNGFAWDNRLETYDPSYYRWTQWLFVKLFKAGLAYRGRAAVNFCPSCKTVLADEQVIKKESGIRNQELGKVKIKDDPVFQSPTSSFQLRDSAVGVCERCETEVVKKELEQWFFRITAYADRLLSNIEKLDWSEKVKVAQRNWIGRKGGALINFTVSTTNYQPFDSAQGRLSTTNSVVEVFTTRPDTIFGATFLVLSPDHPLSLEIAKESAEAAQYLEKHSQNAALSGEVRREAEKTGVFSGRYAVNPVTNRKIPIWIADYVLAGYGTGAIMGVPGHDSRDFEFAKRHFLPVIRVVKGPDSRKAEIERVEDVWEGEGESLNSGFLNGLKTAEAQKSTISFLESCQLGKRHSTYHLRDWIISRQRYWGPPIPMIYCQNCAFEGKSWFDTEEARTSNDQLPRTNNQSNSNNQNSKAYSTNNVMPDLIRHPGNGSQVKPGMTESALEIGNSAVWKVAGWYPVPEDKLPVLLPDVEDFRPSGEGASPLANLPSFYETTCPHCGGRARRETDVSDTFLDSSWYFLRYPSVGINSKSQILNSKQDQNPKSQSQNGLGFRVSSLEFPWDPQITRRWLPVNMYIGGAEHSVLHLLYSRFVTMVLHDLDYLLFDEPFSKFRAHGLLIRDGGKMSKSKGNVVNPDEYIAKLGADTLRTYLMFLGPFDQGGDFSDTGIAGIYRFLGRVWTRVLEVIEEEPSPDKVTPSARSPGSAREGVTLEGQANLLKELSRVIKKVGDDIENLRLNTAIAALMGFLNLWGKSKESGGLSVVRSYLLLLAPFAPHLTEELWSRLKRSDLQEEKFRSIRPQSQFSILNSQLRSIHRQSWPSYNEGDLVEEIVTLVIEVNGKLRDRLTLSRTQASDQKVVSEKAAQSATVSKHLTGKEIKKTIFVPGRLINFVV